MVQKCNCPASLIIVCASKEWNLLLELLLWKHLTSLVPRCRCHHGTQGSCACFIHFSCVHQHVMFFCLQFHQLVLDRQFFFTEKSELSPTAAAIQSQALADLEGHADTVFSLTHNQWCVCPVFMNMCKVQLDTDFLTSVTAKEAHFFWLLAS